MFINFNTTITSLLMDNSIEVSASEEVEPPNLGSIQRLLPEWKLILRGSLSGPRLISDAINI